MKMSKETTPEQVMKKLLEEWEDNPLHTIIKAERQGAKILFTSKGAQTQGDPSQGSQPQGGPSREAQPQDFRIRVSDGRGDDLLGVVKGAVNKVSDLPNSAFDGFRARLKSI